MGSGGLGQGIAGVVGIIPIFSGGSFPYDFPANNQSSSSDSGGSNSSGSDSSVAAQNPTSAPTAEATQAPTQNSTPTVVPDPNGPNGVFGNLFDK